MEDLNNPYPDINWADEPTTNVIDGAKQGIEEAQKELAKRQEQMAREIATLSADA